MTVLEEAGLLNREVETLPNEAALGDLRASGRGLTRPEIAVILAYAKIVLFDQLIAGDLPDDPYLKARLEAYFPAPMRDAFAADIETHRLRREIVATLAANAAINRTGPTFVTAVRDAAGASPSDVVASFVAAHDGFGAADLYRRIDALDGAMPGAAQNALYEAVGAFLQATTRWFVRGGRLGDGLGPLVSDLEKTVAVLRPRLLELATDRAREEAAERRRRWVEAGAPEDLAADIALLPLLALVPDIASVSRETETPLEQTIASYFAITRIFEIGRPGIGADAAGANGLLRDPGAGTGRRPDRRRAPDADGRGAAAKRARARGKRSPPGSSAAATWVERVGRQIAQLAGSGETSVPRLTVAAGLLADLAA